MFSRTERNLGQNDINPTIKFHREKKKKEALAIKRQEQLVKAITLSPKTENKSLDLYNPLAVKHQELQKKAKSRK